MFLWLKNQEKKLWKDGNLETFLIEIEIMKISAILYFRGTTFKENVKNIIWKFKRQECNGQPSGKPENHVLAIRDEILNK